MQSLVFTLLLLPLCCLALPKPSQQYDNQVTLRDDVYRVFWSVSDDVITFEVQVRTRGWFYFGLTTNSSTPDSDLITAWVSVGWLLFFQDRHSNGNGLPAVDGHQDWQGIWGVEVGGVTVVKFRRKLRTCDSEDLDIGQGNVRLIYGWHSQDPWSEGGIGSSEENGALTLTLLNDGRPSGLPADSKNLRFFVNNLVVSQAAVSMYYAFFALPDFDREQYIIQLDAAIQPGNEKYVAHILAQWCDADVDPALVHGRGADGEVIRNDPVLGAVHAKCKRHFWLWLPGQKAWSFPANVGLPIGRPTSSRAISLEVRYWNVDAEQEIFDSSGIVVTITPTPRSISSDAVYQPADSIMVPPHTTDFTTYSICNFETCLQWLQNPPEIQMFAVNVVSYFTGTKAYLRHFRNGVELPLILAEKNVDGDYHNTHYLATPTTINMHTDQLVLECHYDTNGKTSFGYIDGSKEGEMCVAFFHYYPGQGYFRCKHDILKEQFLPLVGVESFFPNGTVTSPPSMAGKHWREVFAELDWTNPELSQTFEQGNAHNSARFSCDTSDTKHVYIEQKQFDMNEYQAPSSGCGQALGNSRDRPPTYNLDC